MTLSNVPRAVAARQTGARIPVVIDAGLPLMATYL
jgi:hypothetical protein